MHCIKASDEASPPPVFFNQIRLLISLHPTHFNDPAKQERFKTKLLSREQFLEELSQLESVVAKYEYPVVFSHNDLVLGNIIYDEKRGKVSIIDYETVMYNYLPYDIAGHLCDFGGIDGIEFSLYPKKDFQLKWIRVYLEARCAFLGENRAVTDREVERLYAVANKFALVCYIFQTVWAVGQAYVSTIDFDFLNFAIVRFEEYKRRKEESLSIPAPE